MLLFDHIFKRKPLGPPRPVCMERDWVGKIVGLLMWSLRDYGITGIETWTVIIEDDNSPALLCGLPDPAENKRYCILGHCERLQRVIDSYPRFGLLAEPAVQDLAFEVCTRAEPQWDAIVQRYHTELAGWYRSQPQLS